MAEGKTDRMWDLSLKAEISMLFFFFAIYIYKDIDVSFLMPIESLHFDLYSSSSM
jgi:hypothetical protein